MNAAMCEYGALAWTMPKMEVGAKPAQPAEPRADGLHYGAALMSVRGASECT